MHTRGGVPLRVKAGAWALVGLFAIASVGPAQAQSQSGEIFGKVVDSSGAALPGVTITLESPVLIQPQSAVTTDSGSYRFPNIPIGVYAVTFELAGFNRHIHRDVRVETAFSAEISPALQVSAVQETVEVSGVTPVVDTKSTSLNATFNQEMLEKLPSARDPWVILEQMPGMVLDRQNVGGSESGQQSSFIAHGSGANQQWNLNGATVTDMSAGGSPMYFDFDSFEEIQIQTGGGDASVQSGGASINLVTKSGSNIFKGSGRLFYVDDSLQGDNSTQELRDQGAGAGNPIKDIKEYGVEIGGPLVRNKAFFWGAVGRQDIGVGVIGFLKPGATDPDDIDSLERDDTELINTNAKLTYQWASNHKSSFYYNYSTKNRNARDVGPLTRIEAAFKQTSPGGLYQADHQWIANDRLMFEGRFTYNQNEFTLDFTSPELTDVQGAFDAGTGISYRSGQRQENIRPSTEVRLDGNYLGANLFGGDHTFKFGTSYRSTPIDFKQHYGGDVTARFTNGVPASADLRRDSFTSRDMTNWSLYLNDSYRRGHLTINVGVRGDYWDDRANPSAVAANSIVPDLLPALSFGGADTGLSFFDVSPRLGVTYDLSGQGRTVIKANVARYFGLGADGAGQINPVAASRLRYAWNDANGDTLVQRNELDLSRILSFANYNFDDPSSLVSPNQVDPNLGNDKTDEILATLEHELMPNFAVSATYIYKKLHNQSSTFFLGLTSDDFVPVVFTGNCGNGSCDESNYTATYYQLRSGLTRPAGTLLRNYDFVRRYHGLEFTARKRFTDRWMLQGSVVLNDTTIHYDSPNAFQDPTNVSQQDGEQTGTLNTRWVAKLSAAYELPYGVLVSGFFNARDGVPFVRTMLIQSRQGGLSDVNLIVKQYGTERYDNFYQLDLRLAKDFRFGRTQRLSGYVDVFNVANANTVLGRVTNQLSRTANNATQIVAPRVVRLGVRYAF